MSEHIAFIEWNRNGSVFVDNRYSRAHQWRFDGGVAVPASSSPHVVRAPLSDPANVDPEEAFVAAVSSCHMLWFLSIAAKAGYVVDRYFDRPKAHLVRREDGKEWIGSIVFSPEIQFSGTKAPDEAAVAGLHHSAHARCALANSIRTEIVIQGTWAHAP